EEMKGFAPKEGYQFSRWLVTTSNGNFSVGKDKINGNGNTLVEIQGNTTITYECEAIAGYTLRFDGDGGTGTMASIEAASGKEITLPACAFTHPDGKRFLGWIVTEDKENPGPSQLKKPGETIVSTVNMLAKPKWSAKSYWNITVAPGAGTGDAYTDAVVRGEAYKTPGCFFTAPAGQIFDKWEIGPGVYAAAGEQISIAGDITITAIWKKSQEEPEDQPDPKTLEGDVVVKTGDTYEKYSSLADAFAAITKKNNKSGEYEIYVNKALDEKTFKLPAKAKKITLTTQGEGKIRTQVLTVNVKCDLILNADMACSKTGKRIAFKMAKDANLTVNKGFDTLGKLSGNKATSKLTVNDNISVPSVMSFQSVSMGNAGLVSIADKGRLTNIVTFNGRTILGKGSVMNITEAGKAELMLTRDANGTLPKLTVAKVTTELSVETDINLEAGETVLKTGREALDCAKITFPETGLAAFRYNREIRAEYPDALTIGTKDYPSLEKAYADMTDGSVDYIINLNRELTVKKLTLPKKLKSLTVNGNGHTILAGAAVSVNPRYALTFRNLKLTVFKMGKTFYIKDVKLLPVNINALGGLLLEDVDIYAKTVNIRGKGNLDIGYVSVYNFVNDVMTPAAIDQISGFTTATVTGPISIRKPFVVPTITLKSLAEVTLAAKTATITAKKSLTGESGSKIILQTALKPITLSNDASGISGSITLDPGSVAAGTQVFATRMPVEKLNEVITVLNGTLKAGKPGKVLLEKTGA
nr:InlB B-repeat-containing protein [Lachnospiraceae bacterium]